MGNSSFADATRDHLRTIVAAVDQQITRLPAGDGDRAADELRTSWAALVTLLALGAAPETRQCPACHGTGMRAASRCGNCWAKLPPLGPANTELPRSNV